MPEAFLVKVSRWVRRAGEERVVVKDVQADSAGREKLDGWPK